MKPRVHALWPVLLLLLLAAAWVAWFWHENPDTNSATVTKPLPQWQVTREDVQDPISSIQTHPDAHAEAWMARNTRIGANLLPSLRVYQSCQWKVLAGPGTALFSPPDQIETTVTFDKTGDYLLRLTATDGTETVNRDLTVRVRPAPFDLWKARKFAAAGASSTGDYADPDSDGIANLMEYALMLDPNKPDVAGLPDPVVRNGQVSVTYKRPASAVDLTFQTEWTDDLITWHATEISEQVIMTVGDMQIVRASAPTPKDQPGRFLRLRVKGP